MAQTATGVVYPDWFDVVDVPNSMAELASSIDVAFFARAGVTEFMGSMNGLLAVRHSSGWVPDTILFTLCTVTTDDVNVIGALEPAYAMYRGVLMDSITTEEFFYVQISRSVTAAAAGNRGCIQTGWTGSGADTSINVHWVVFRGDPANPRTLPPRGQSVSFGDDTGFGTFGAALPPPYVPVATSPPTYVPPPVTVIRTTSITAAAGGSYNGSGNPRAGGGGNLAYYGYTSNVHGRQRSVAVFDPTAFTVMAAGIPASSVVAMTLEFDNAHTYWNGGGAVHVTFRNFTGLPGVLDGATDAGTFAVSVPKTGHVAVPVPSHLWDWILGKNGPSVLPAVQFTSVDGGTGGYGYLNWPSVRLTITYRS
jgi:hypothetical protein